MGSLVAVGKVNWLSIIGCSHILAGTVQDERFSYSDFTSIWSFRSYIPGPHSQHHHNNITNNPESWAIMPHLRTEKRQCNKLMWSFPWIDVWQKSSFSDLVTSIELSYCILWMLLINVLIMCLYKDISVTKTCVKCVSHLNYIIIDFTTCTIERNKSVNPCLLL